MNEVNIDEMNKKRQEELEKMLKDGQLSCMTECAYGKTIADMESSKPAIEKKEEKK